MKIAHKTKLISIATCPEISIVLRPRYLTGKTANRADIKLANPSKIVPISGEIGK